MRVHEELAAGGAVLSYPALTAFCRRQGIGQDAGGAGGPVSLRAGRGDAARHVSARQSRWAAGSTKRRPPRRCCATRACCSSRSIPRSSDSTARCFSPTRCAIWAARAERVMIDNTHVVVLRGTGREMIPVPEMEAFAERFGFRFVAHEIGDANRSARVERPFSFIENNFLAGRTFASWEDLNQPGAPVVRPRQLDLQETYPRGAARTVRRRAPASETAAGVDSRSVSSASAHGGCGRLRLGALHSLLGAGLLDRAPGGSARDHGTRSRSNWMRATSSRMRAR